MAMTPEEVNRAWAQAVEHGDREEFERVLDELWSGELVMEFPPEGTIIRARRPDDPPSPNPHADMPRPR